MDLSLETCEIFSPNIEAKCLARNEKKAMEILKPQLQKLWSNTYDLFANVHLIYSLTKSTSSIFCMLEVRKRAKLREQPLTPHTKDWEW